MKKLELRQLIKEEISKMMNEDKPVDGDMTQVLYIPRKFEKLAAKNFKKEWIGLAKQTSRNTFMFPSQEDVIDFAVEMTELGTPAEDIIRVNHGNDLLSDTIAT